MSSFIHSRLIVKSGSFSPGRAGWVLLSFLFAAVSLTLLFWTLTPIASARADFPVDDRSSFGTGADSTESVAVGDVDGDGDLDLAVGNVNPQQNVVYLNDGAGNFPNTVGYTRTFGAGADSVAVGDVDGDGDLDLVTGKYGAQNIVYLNDGAGNFPTTRAFGTGTDLTENVAVGDLDGDGDLDLVSGNANQQNVVYLNDGAANFTVTRNFGTGSDATWSVAVADVDGDGDLDLVTGNGGQDVVYLNDGAGNFLTGRNFGPGTDSTLSVAVGDVDGDGDLDLVTGTFNQQNAVYLNDGVGNFPSQSNFGAGSQRTESVAVGDVDNDGDLDIITGNWSQQNVVYLNDGAGNFANTTSDTRTFGSGADQTDSVAAADVDSDGDLDLVTGNYGEINVVYLNNGAGDFPSASGRNFGTGSDSTASVAVGDMDGDGDLDIVTGNRGLAMDVQNVVYLNDGAGNFPNTAGYTRTFGTGTDQTNSVGVGDMDGDGDLDIVVGNSPIYSPTLGADVPGSGQNVVYLNDGAGNFSTVRNFGTSTDDTRGVAVGDIEGDGDLDIVVGNMPVYSATLGGDVPGSGQDVVYLNDGAGNFPIGRNFGSGSGRTWGVAVGDLDGDGDLDIILASDEVMSVAYLNDGAGNFPAGNERNIGAAPDSTISVAVGDMDNDGDLDIVTGNVFKQNFVYLNDGAGNFVNRRSFGTGADATWSVAVGDMDGDGDLDIIAGNFGQNVVYLNDGAGNFPSASGRKFGTGTDDTESVAVGDMDGDGDVDLVTGNSGQNAVYLNGLVGGARQSNTTPSVDMTRPGFARNANLFSSPQILSGTIPISYTLFDAEGDRVAYVRAYYSPDGGGQWYTATAASGTAATNLTATVSGTTHVFSWDVLASGFFGQSDNVVFRMEAFPSYLPTVNTMPDPNQRPYASATTFPFRVRGTQVKVISGTAPAVNALVYRLAASQSLGATPIANSAGRAFRTDGQGYLQGRGQINLGDRLVALWPITSTGAYTLYYTSAAPTLTGLEAFTVTTPGVQTLAVLAANRLILFDLKVSLEWDARNDTLFLTQLQADLRRASELLFDWTNGQAALGRVVVYQAKEHWTDAHIRVYATNSFRPNAVIGGVVSQPISETNVVNGLTNTLDYAPGQVSMPAVWNRFGDAGGSVGEDWPRTLAHELAHYLFFLDDAYLGLNASGQLIALDACTGTAMADPYRADYSEFKQAGNWSPGCDNTLAARTSGRPEWTTLTRFYPLLALVNPGPNGLPLDVTQVEIVNPLTPAATLNAPIFHLTQSGGRVTPGPDARAVLFQDDRLIDLGRATQDQVMARGASPGDRLCLYEITAERLGCETVTAGDTELALSARPGWQPEVTLTPVTSRTINLSVANAPAGVTLQARLYPVDGSASTIITLVQGSASLPMALAESLTAAAFTNTIYLPLISKSGPVTFVNYSGTFQLSQPALAGSVVVWVSEGEPRREVIADYSLGGNPAPPKRSRRRGGAPTTSPDGQVTLYGDLDFALGEFYAIQSVTRLPRPPAWATVVGKGYRLLKSAGAPDFTGSSLNFSYFASDVPAGEENFLRVYYYDGATWQALPTQVDRAHGSAIAATQGAGLYALMSSFPVPLSGPGWNQFTYPVQGMKLVTEALVSVSGYYTTVYGAVLTDTQDPWKVYDVTAPNWVNDLGQLEFAKSYWINVSQSITLQVTGSGPQPALGAAALPSPPATFYGAVQSGLGFTPAAGMVVTAWIGGNACGQGKTLLVSGQVMYTINVLPEGTGGAAGCGAPGRTITFKVGAQTMTTTAPWDIDELHALTLTP